MTAPHVSVLLNEVVEAFKDVELKTFLDGTLGAGGHAAAILQAHPEIEKFYGLDQDTSALEIARERLLPWHGKIELIHTNFSGLAEALKEQKCDGILLDLGVSSMQLDQPERGFSISRPGPLDMRMNMEGPLTAADVVNTWSEYDLARIFRDYGEEKRWRAAARAVVKARQEKPILTTQELVDLLLPVVKDFRSQKSIHPLTLIFQALRIAVNEELQVLEVALKAAMAALNPGGRLAVISFHSLEDRIAKQYFRYLASDKEDTRGIAGVFRDKQPIVRDVTRKPVTAGEKECAENPRARSAKLRVVEKI
ncbi:MAG: 16S rRNA (cytosine(1402)-N(4))-methyltransferase RsmH [Chlamydiales bacterium]|nr:16S rRNA (cytosine(1402)-N(4))-methyltransferase RsmH [Chlamydiales bacterium]